MDEILKTTRNLLAYLTTKTQVKYNSDGSVIVSTPDGKRILFEIKVFNEDVYESIRKVEEFLGGEK